MNKEYDQDEVAKVSIYLVKAKNMYEALGTADAKKVSRYLEASLDLVKNKFEKDNLEIFEKWAKEEENKV